MSNTFLTAAPTVMSTVIEIEGESCSKGYIQTLVLIQCCFYGNSSFKDLPGGPSPKIEH